MFNVGKSNGVKLSSVILAPRGHHARVRLFVQHARPFPRHHNFMNAPVARSYWWSSSKPQAPSQPPISKGTPDVSTTPSSDTTEQGAQVTIQPEIPAVDAQETLITTTTDPAAVDVPVELDSKVDISPLQYGDLSELGLISWTPAGFIRWTLELFQVTTGLPWFHTIVATTLLYRMALVPISISSLRNSARLLPMTPRITALKREMDAARQARDILLMQRAALKQKKIYADAGVSMTPMLINPFIQLPVSLGLFFGIKKMCTLPVEQLKYSGLAILPDLTISDPYFILPVMTAVLINTQIVLGVREINLADRPEVGHMMNLLRIVSLPGIYFMGSLPSGLMVSLTTGIGALLLQTAVLRINPVRRMLNIPIAPAKGYGGLPTFRQTFQAGIDWFNQQKKDAAAAALESNRRRDKLR